VQPLSSWRGLHVPLHGVANFASNFYAQCAARLMQPSLGPRPSDAALDSLSISSLELSARRKALYHAQMEATALAAAAYDDATLRAVLSAAAEFGTAVESTALALMACPVYSIDSDARRFLAAARVRALLAAAAAAAVKERRPNGFSPLFLPSARTSAVIGGSVSPLSLLQLDKMANNAGSLSESVERGEILMGAPKQQQPHFLAENGSLAFASSYYGANSYISEQQSVSALDGGKSGGGATTPWYGSSALPRPRTGQPNALSLIEMSPALAPQPVPSSHAGALPPSLSLASATTSLADCVHHERPFDSNGTGSLQSVRRRSLRPPALAGSLNDRACASVQQQRRASRVASEYDSRNTSGNSRDARLSAALIASTDLSALQLLSSSIVVSESGDSASPVATSRLRASTTLLGTIAEASEVPASTAAPMPSAALGSGRFDTTSPVIDVSASDDVVATDVAAGLPPSRLSSESAPTLNASENAVPAVPPREQDVDRIKWQAYSEALYVAAASAGALAGEQQEVMIVFAAWSPWLFLKASLCCFRLLYAGNCDCDDH
jgi:hypothetical protein